MNHSIQWEDEHLEFAFKNEIPGKVKMQTRKLDTHDWIKIDKTYPDQMNLRKKLKMEKFEHIYVSNNSESTMAAKQELLEILGDYLPTRYPTIFSKSETSSKIFNNILEETVNLTPCSENQSVDDPLIRAGDLTQEDWAILEYSKEEGAYVLTAGIVYFPMRWSLSEKFMKPMKAIHRPVIPFVKSLYPNVHSLFDKMRPDTPVCRSNWAIFNDLEGPLDLYTPLGHASRNGLNQLTVFEGEKTGECLIFRAEYQTLRKLPKTKAIVFSIRTYQRFLSDFKGFQPDDRSALIRSIETLDREIHIYKGAEFWEDAAVKYLKMISVQDKENGETFASKDDEISKFGFKTMAIFGCGLALATASIWTIIKLRK